MWIDCKARVRISALMLLLASVCQGREAPLKSSQSSAGDGSSPVAPASRSTAPEISFDSASVLGMSNLAKLISSAVKDKSTEDDSTTTMAPTTTEKAKEEEQVEDDGLSDTGMLAENLKDIILAISGGGNKEEDKGGEDENDKKTEVTFEPASPGQFGEVGSGSKFMEYLPDLTQYSVETSKYGAIAGVGAAALMALGAVFAVPVAPVILRRAGVSGWSGLPSLSDLFSWWSEPEPSALMWAEKNSEGYYDSEGYYVPTAGPSGYYSDDQQYYYSYDTSESGSQDTHRYVDPDTNQAIPVPVSEYVSYVERAEPTRAPARRRPPHGMKRPLWKWNNNRRNSDAGAKEERVDGHEYVTLQEINQIGDDSVRLLRRLAQGDNMDDLYAYRDGVSRRRGTVQQHPQHPQQNLRRRQPHQEQQHEQQYSQQPNYEYGQELFTQSYMAPESEEQESYDHSTGAEGHPYHFSLSDAQPVVRYGGAQEDDVGSPRTGAVGVKVAESEFPYKFHKEE